MPIENLTTEEYRRLVKIMADMHAWQSIQQRQANMEMAGLERFKRRVDFNTPADVFSGLFVSDLRQFGSLEGEPALARLVRHLVTLLGEGDDRTFLESLLGNYVQPPDAPTAVLRSGTNTILFLSANPQHDLALDKEMRLVERAIQRASRRDKFNLEKQTDLHLKDVQEHLLRFQPHIVHFAGHGDNAGSLAVQGEGGAIVSVPITALRETFAILHDNIRLVVLNACWSQPLAAALAEVVDCVVGMSAEITDEAACDFSEAFYYALASGRSVHEAFALGVNALDLQRLRASAVPHLTSKAGVNPDQIYFA
ncbi:MAG: CHAT domain-containing protein [Chloroflexi bacterium CFX4]|nr:CHAT domain-containing protein [Chloroflexi bacterium CFX4]MDL1921651.1 CHAT domain-containing protein [Chloroflexi bacterium CFX3]